MTKEDKAFIREALSGLRAELKGDFNELKTEFAGLKGEFAELRDEVHYQGITIERLEDKIDLVAENTTGLFRRVTILEERAGTQ